MKSPNKLILAFKGGGKVVMDFYFIWESTIWVICHIQKKNRSEFDVFLKNFTWNDNLLCKIILLWFVCAAFNNFDDGSIQVIWLNLYLFCIHGIQYDKYFLWPKWLG